MEAGGVEALRCWVVGKGSEEGCQEGGGGGMAGGEEEGEGGNFEEVLGEGD